MAEGAQGTPNYIMPFVSGKYDALANVQVQQQLWPRLYAIGTAANPNQVNSTFSLAYPPVYSQGNTVVTVSLKPYRWSDGAALTARDVTFFMNLLQANKASWGHYTPGNMPDNVTSWTAHGSSTVVFDLSHPVNPVWFTDDQLSYIVPLPQQAWDKTSGSSKVGNYDQTATGAQAVYAYLNGQGQDTATYDSNPLWQVVDGAWKLQKFENNGFVALTPNRAYSGPAKPQLAKFEMLPFTSGTAEFNAVLSSSVDVGYVPATDLSAEPRVKAAGYGIMRSELESVNMLSLNYNSPVAGPLVAQLYIRQVLNHLMDQPGQIRALLNGSGGYTDYGPIPPQPSSAYEAPSQKVNPFSISAARSLLLAHGWSIPSTGAAVCVRPGVASNECGAGIAKGRTLVFALMYVSGSSYLQGEMESYKSDASQAGVVLNLTSAPFNSIVGAICGTSTCNSPGWEIANWGAGFSWDFGVPDPTGANLFEGHVGLDYPTP
ncbi:MAG: ABC transporter substrate-binding protein, partial [Candidatus Dormibacteria bacterium]